MIRLLRRVRHAYGHGREEHVHSRTRTRTELKLRILDFYNQKLDLRYRMRKFAVENELIDAKKVCTTL